MASALPKTVFLVVLFLCCFRCGRSAFDTSESLKIPASDFADSVRFTIGIVRQVIGMVRGLSKYALAGDFRQSNAVSDCLDLMDLSVDQLNWTISASQNSNGKYNVTGNIGADMKTWLSGALINQDTCKEGLYGTNNIVLKLIANSLEQIASSVSDILSKVNTTPTTQPTTGCFAGGSQSVGRKLIDNNKFPDWLRTRDRNLLESANTAAADSVVAPDGTGNFTTIEDAVLAAPEYSTRKYVIYIKKGVYKEYVEIGKKKWNIMLMGDGVNNTVISGNRSFVDGWTTYRSATFAVKGQGFIARDITFENTAGPEKHQAVAFRSDSDLSVLFRCAITGYQDTLYAHSQRQFYRECQITGTVDFIFGDGTAVFQNCQILARKGLPDQKNTITAQGRKEPVENTGFSIQSCNILVEPEVSNSTYTYLGRPWKLYSRTVIMQSYISDAIRPDGWLEWNGTYALDTLFYGEYLNYGPGANSKSRVKWPGYRIFNTSAQATNFTVSQFITGNQWLPSTGVRYAAGLEVCG
ncbi:hypothetical protein OROGR_018569 [Orobanche gracilis]